MEILIYLKTLILLVTLSVCGFIIVRRICEDLRLQLLLPTGVIVGIAFYIFLLNSIALFLKGPPVFYVALAVEILFVYILNKKIKAKDLIFSQHKVRVIWLISLLIWFIFLLYVSATGNASSGDWQNHSTLASLFIRGDFPIHSPFQPDRLSSYHVGGPEILGALRLLTGASYTFLGSILSFVTLFAISQILQWILKVQEKTFNLILLILIPLTALVSLGNFMIVWPYQFSFPHISDGIVSWLHNLPTLYSTYDPFGAPASLDSLNLFLHRMLALSIFSALIPLTLLPNKSNRFLSSVVILILLATLALSDESVFIVTAPAIVLVLFFTLFEKNIKLWILFSLITLAVTVFQGGLINEMIFKSDSTIARVLLFPDDAKGPTAEFENYRSYRLEAQSSKMLPDKVQYNPFRWFHFGAVWQITALFIASCAFTLIFKKKLTNKLPPYLIWLFCISGFAALIAYHGIVPKGIYHMNGNRFLSLSYQLSGIGIIIFIILGWIHLKDKSGLGKFFSIGVKILLMWLVITSILPALALLFPRQKYNWFKSVSDAPKAELVWIKDNLKVDTRILPFMEKFPSSGPILELVREVGIFTPVWFDKPASQGFEVSPPYLDLFFTLNPEILKILKVEYIMTNKLYRSTLSVERLADLENSEYFQVVYSDNEKDTMILKILPAYFLKAENYKGTFYELSQILPLKGAFFIEESPGIVEGVWRVAFLTLQMRDFEMYYSTKFIPFYNFIINVDLKFNGESYDKYDYLVLGPKADPALICRCRVELMWSQSAGYVNVWKVI